MIMNSTPKRRSISVGMKEMKTFQLARVWDIMKLLFPPPILQEIYTFLRCLWKITNTYCVPVLLEQERLRISFSYYQPA